MILPRHPNVLKFSQSYGTELNDVWEEKQDPLLWCKKDHKLDRKNRVRSEKIEKLRDPFLSETKERKHYYGASGNYNYKSDEHQKHFFEILQAAGLLKLESDDTERELHNSDGYYHKISIPKQKIDAKLYMEKLELEEIESKYSLGLGGMEVDF